MPLHTFECKSCNNVFDKIQRITELSETELCDCGSVAMKRWSSDSSPNVRVFQAGWFHHITHEPLYIRTKQELINACKKHDCKSAYIEDSYNRRY